MHQQFSKTRFATLWKFLLQYYGKIFCNFREKVLAKNRIIPSSDLIAGYLYVFLTSPYGYELIKRFTYGSVVDEIDDNHVSQIEIPLMNIEKQEEINLLALEANKLRYEAYKLEQQALIIINEEVIHKT
jgi:type I restriction enzyme S subunit